MARKKAVKMTLQEKLLQEVSTKKMTNIGNDRLIFEDTVVMVNKDVSLQELKKATMQMVDIMETVKNQHGYKAFISLIDELEFMFCMAFLTDFGLQPSLGAYVTIMESMMASGYLERFYEMMDDRLCIARRTFDRMYKVWESEYIALFSQMAASSAPMNELAVRILGYIGSEEPVMESEAVAYNAFVENMMNKNADVAMDNDAEAVVLPAQMSKGMFQKRELSDEAPVLTVIEGGKKT